MRTFIFLSLFTICHSFNSSAQYSLTVTVDKIPNSKGFIGIAIYNQAAHFPKEGKQMLGGVVAAKQGQASYTFTNLPQGDYAIALFHDENADKKCNKNLIGIPKEMFGFSNNIRPKLSPPKFSECKISLSENKTIKVDLIKM